MAFKMKGFPGINSKGYNNMKDGRSKSAAFQKNGEAKPRRQTRERHNPDELKSKGLVQRDDGMIRGIKNLGPEGPVRPGKVRRARKFERPEPLKKDDIVQKNKQKQFNKKVTDLQGQWKNLKDRNSNKAKQLKKEASKLVLTLDQD